MGGRIAVAVVSYRTPSLTAAAVRSALASAADVVIVVDNASGDETMVRLRGISDPRLVIVENASNEGYGAAANTAARSVSTEAVLFLNSDAELSNDAMKRLLAELDRWDGRAIVGARLVGPHGEIQRSAGLLPAPSDLLIRWLGLSAIGRWFAELPLIGGLVRGSRIADEYESARTAVEAADTSMVSGACFVVGRTAFQELGGFDERFFLYFEDADICRRAAAAGYATRYVPDAVVSHIGGASSSQDYHFGPMHARSMRQYLGKWYGPGGSAVALVLVWLRTIGFTLTLRPGTRRAWAALRATLRDEDPRR